MAWLCVWETPRHGRRPRSGGPASHLAEALLPAAAVSGGIAGGHAGLPAGRRALRNGRPSSRTSWQLEPTARGGAAATPTASRRGEVGAPAVGRRGGRGMARPVAEPAAAARGRQQPPSVQRLAPLRCADADPLLQPLRPHLRQHRNAPRSAAPRRPLLLVGLLQIVLGCCLVALNFWALSLSRAPQVKSACPFWAGFTVILSGILGLATWKRPMMLLANLFVLLSIICLVLNLAGFISGCQGIQFVTSVPRCDLADIVETKICFCCQELHLAQCTEEESALNLYHVKSCSAAHLLLKEVLFALCALNILTTIVCLVAAALRYLRIFATTSSIGDSQTEDQDHILDPDDFVPPMPPPSYFVTFCSCTPQMSCRMLGSDVISLLHVHGAQIKDVEVFCPLDPPPPYEAVWSQSRPEQEGALQRNVVEAVYSGEVSKRRASQGEEIPESSSRVSFSPSTAGTVLARGACRRAFSPWGKRSKSDPVLHSQLLQVFSCEAAMQTELKPQLCAVTLQKTLRARALRGRPQSLTDYKSYTDTKRLVAWILKQSSCSMSPDIHELVENTMPVLKSDEKFMAEATTSAAFLEQVMAPVQQAVLLNASVLPFRQLPGLLHLESCGDLSTFTTDEDQLAEKRIQKAEHERPHSVIGVFSETVV